MQKQEFERLAKIEVTDETYTRVIEPMYLATDLSKQDFIKLLNLKSLVAPKIEKEKNIKKMLVRDRSGFTKTPNGYYYHIEYVELVDVDIRTGKFIVRPLEDRDFQNLREKGHDMNLGYDYDFDYTQCIDTKKKPITLVA